MTQQTLSQPAATTTTAFAHAIVIGSSITGLTTARVLLNHFERVTIIERDRLPEESAEFRKGVPQARHPHALLRRGQMIMEGLFPGLTDELLAGGSIPINMGSETRWNLLGQWRPSFDSALVQTACSRPLLEGTMRRRLLTEPRVKILEGYEVTGLLMDESRTRTTGIRVRQVGQHHNEATDAPIYANLVVDASGRASRAPEWLQAQGFEAPAETVVDARASYATRIYRKPANFDAWKMIYIQPIPGVSKRGGIIIPMEGERWHVTLIGMMGDYPANDEASYLEFAKSLASTELYEAIKDAEPLTPVYGYRRAENRMRHYDQLARSPENFLLCGDAVLAFNPVYGQGMTIASMGAQMLADCLEVQCQRRGEFPLDGLARTFQHRLTEVLAGPWQLAAGEDTRWLASEGEAEMDPAAVLMGNYMAQVMQASLVNPVVADAFYHVMHMMEAPTLFFRPDIVLHVFASVERPAPQAAATSALPQRPLPAAVQGMRVAAAAD